MAEFLRFPNFGGCKVADGTLLPHGIVRVTHLTPLADRIEDIPAKTGDMVVAEMPEKKVLAEKEKKKRTKRKAEVIQHVSSPIPLSHSRPLETLTNEAHVSKNAYAGRLDALRNQTDEQSPPRHENVDEHMVDGDAENEHVDENIANEGHNDNTVLTMAEFLRFPNFWGCKVADGTLLPPGIVRVTHLTPLADRIEDIPAKIGDMVVAEMPEKKVLAEKEK
nr:hypothetical protein [Tanacetum cinerariifolium]